MKAGILALQGDVAAHAGMIRSAGGEPIEVRTPAELAGIDALIIPGGESTTIRKLARAFGLVDAVAARARDGLPIFGTCAGLIVCAREIADGDDPVWPLVDVAVRRNAYGRQAQSFEADLDVAGVGEMRAVFIRAPRIERVGPGVNVLASHGDHPVLIRAGTVLLASFHPEIAGDDRLHRMFLDVIASA